jgi:iron complex outermembrane receptor protein
MFNQKSSLMQRIGFTVLFLLFYSFTPINAQESEDLMEMSLDELLSLTVVSASKQAEPLQETPVPVTVITSEMIQNIGAKNLKDVLITYVPGITFSQDHNEINVAMRGVYASSQQKILVMLDGHRLNCRAYSEANPDYSISLDKIKQIEVLRGPGSSLYGNVSLAAVINIVTKSGGDLNGASVSVGMGNYGQQTYSLVYGKEFEKGNELLLWGTFYKADGQEIKISKDEDYSASPKDGYAIVEGVKDKPSYDLGLKYRVGSFSLLANMRYCKYIEPFSGGGAKGEVYDYDSYRTFLGVGPGLGSEFAHLGVKYVKNFADDLELQVHAYNDYNKIQVSLIISPAAKIFGAPNWDEYDLGFISQLSKGYQLADLGTGNIIIGAQIDKMEVYDSSFPLGFFGGDSMIFKDTKDALVLDTGKEIIYSAFCQIKHKFSDELILNLGLRYDDKDRHKSKNVTDISPRLAMIYLPNEKLNLKVSYSQSFVDAPYWYRYNTLPGYMGAEDLKPEHLKSFQFTPIIKLDEGRLQFATNFFYNHLTDFIYNIPKPVGNEKNYSNAGVLKSWGVEEEVHYLRDTYKIRANFLYQRAVEAEDYGVKDEQIHNIPNLTANLIFDFNPFYSMNKNVWFNITAKYVGEQLSPITSAGFESPENKVDPAFILNAGFRVSDVLLEGISIDARIYNALDEEYYQGGSVNHPYPQPGLWYMGKLIYNF